MNKYKCDHSPESPRTDEQVLDLVCMGCLKAWIARHNLMHLFITKIVQNPNCHWDEEAKDLLDEMGI